MKLGHLLAGAMLAAMAAAPASAAQLIYDLNISDPAAGLVSGVLGQVKATEVGSNLQIDVTLDPTKAEFRYSPDDQHISFVFQLPNTGFTIDNVTDGSLFGVHTGALTETPFGSWNYALDCAQGSGGKVKTACQPGWTPGVNPTTLSFTIDGASLGSLVGTHSYGGQPIWFAADVVTSNGGTGAVGATTPSTPGVPEPAAWATMIVGFFGLGGLARRRRSLATA